MGVGSKCNECGQAQTEGGNVFTSAPGRCVDAPCPTFKRFTNEALMSGHIVGGDIAIDQLPHIFNDSLNYLY